MATFTEFTKEVVVECEGPCVLPTAVSGRREDFGSDGIIFYMNGQSLDALAFRVVSLWYSA